MKNDVRHEDGRTIGRVGRAAPAVVWGVLMAAALAGAGATLWNGDLGAPAQARLVAAAGEDRALRRDVAKLSAERDALAGRLAAVERSLGDVKLALRETNAPETTGSIDRPAPAPAAPTTPAPAAADPQRANGFALSLGADASLEAAQLRWSALSARYPQALARLAPRARRGGATGAVDLVAGPFASRQEAERACGALAQQGLACDTTAYAGEPLGRP